MYIEKLEPGHKIRCNGEQIRCVGEKDIDISQCPSLAHVSLANDLGIQYFCAWCFREIYQDAGLILKDLECIYNEY